MKRITSQLLALLFLVSAIGACSKEQAGVSPIVPQEEIPSKNVKQIEVSLTATTNEPRIYQNIATSPKTTPVLSEADIDVRIVIGYNGQYEHQTVTFKKVKGENKATFSGKLNVPEIGTDTYTITAAILSQKDGREYTTVGSDNKLRVKPTTTLLVATNNVVNSTIPYLAQTTARLSTDGKALEKTTLTFRPSGTLLQIKLTNWTGTAKTFSKVRFVSNAFVTNWSYDLTNISGGNLKAGEAVTASTDQVFDLPQPVTLADNATAADTYYLWVMATNVTDNLLTKVFAVTSGGVEIRAFKRKTPIKEGLLTAHIKPIPPMPLEYLSQDALVGTEAPFSFTSGATPTFYAAEEIHNLAKLGDITIGDKQYYMPSANEIRSIFHENRTAIRPTNTNTTSGLSVSFSNVSFPWNPNSTIKGTSVYKGDGANLVYGLRFETGNSRYLMAYRYEWIGTFAVTSTDSKLRITSRYLGEDYKSATIETIANEAFWSTDKEEDVTVDLRTHGYIEYDPINYGGDLLATSPIREAGQNGYIYARPSSVGATTKDKDKQGNLVDVYFAEFFRFDRSTGMWGVQNVRIDQRPTRLFIRKNS